MTGPIPIKRLVIATNNRHKLEEIRATLVVEGLELLPLSEFPDLPPMEEVGATYEENAVMKAETIARHTGISALGDDTGLEVDALGGAPGVYSARFAGPTVSFKENREKLLKEMEGVPREKRTARFRCTLALVTPGGEKTVVEGVLEGLIAESDQGSGGFGYDPVFYVPEAGRTLGEMSAADKNKLSHRGLALRKIQDYFQSGCSAAW